MNPVRPGGSSRWTAFRPWLLGSMFEPRPALSINIDLKNIETWKSTVLLQGTFKRWYHKYSQIVASNFSHSCHVIRKSHLQNLHFMYSMVILKSRCIHYLKDSEMNFLPIVREGSHNHTWICSTDKIRRKYITTCRPELHMSHD